MRSQGEENQSLSCGSVGESRESGTYLKVKDDNNEDISKIMDGEKDRDATEGEGMWSSRARLEQHRLEVAGRVNIPDMWEQEDLLKNWIDSSTFDAVFVTKKISSARSALILEGRRTRATDVRT